jgi:hypothetical protein
LVITSATAREWEMIECTRIERWMELEYPSKATDYSVRFGVQYTNNKVINISTSEMVSSSHILRYSKIPYTGAHLPDFDTTKWV